MYKNQKIGVVIPAYNESRFIAEVIRRVPEYVDSIFVVDDGSQDNTGNIADTMASQSQGRVRVIRHSHNSGVGKAIVTGYKSSLDLRINIVAVMAGDNQMEPAQLPRLLDPIIDGVADYTVGDRISNLRHMKGMSNWRRLGNWILRWLTRIAAGNMAIRDPQNGYTAISSEALSRLDLDRIYPRYGYCNDMLVKLSVAKARIKQIAMPAVYGDEKSKIRYHRYIPSVSRLLLKDFVWRIKMQVIQRGNVSRPGENRTEAEKSLARRSF
jgi:glycosyltransferase involved in cell wall biosynthesis